MNCSDSAFSVAIPSNTVSVPQSLVWVRQEKHQYRIPCLLILVTQGVTAGLVCLFHDEFTRKSLQSHNSTKGVEQATPAESAAGDVRL